MTVFQYCDALSSTKTLKFLKDDARIEADKQMSKGSDDD